MPLNRRSVLSLLSASLTASAAGCLGDGNGDDNNQIEPEDEPFDDLGVETFELLDRGHDPHEEMAYMHDDHWHGSFHPVPHGEYLSVGAHVEDESGDTIDLGDDYTLQLSVAPGGSEEIVSFDHHGDHVHVHGEEEGITEVVALIVHDGHVDYQSDRISVQVSDDADHHYEDAHDDH